jgi:alpha-beta hydrolase superfamily lysophospholipase
LSRSSEPAVYHITMAPQSTKQAVPTHNSSSDVSDDEWAQLLKEEADRYPTPAIDKSTIWLAGAFIFALAILWPPLILVGTYFLSVFLPYSFRVNDDGASRRKLLDTFDKHDTLSGSRREVPENVRLENGYWTNDRGSLMYWTILTPKDKPIKAVLCHCHGFLDTPTFTKRKELTMMAQHGIAVVMVDYEGHGRSDGALGLIMDWAVLANDVHTFFLETTTAKFHGKKVFLMGESMGGAVAFTIIQAHPDAYHGVNFVAPMCKISKDMIPPEWVISLARKITGPTGTASRIGYLPIAPSKADLKMSTFKLPHKRALNSRVPSVYARKPRLATGRELLNATTLISESLAEFSLPFLIQHGTADRVTDPKLSQALYDESKSNDKTIRLYDGMWHALTAGEPEENAQRVLNDSIQWILERAEGDKKLQ